MKRFLVIYIILSVLLLVFIYFFTLIRETNSRSVDLYYSLAGDALDEDRIDPFMKYQSIAYRILSSTSDETWDIHVVQVLASIDGEYVNQFSVFAFPNKAVNHATELEDPYDMTGLVITDSVTEETLYSTEADPDYDGYAVSYGISVIGFYFYAVPLDESGELAITLSDYFGQTIHESAHTYDALEASLIEAIHDGTMPVHPGFTLGYSQDEIEELLDLEQHLRPVMTRNVTIFLVIDIAIGAFLYHIQKSRKENKPEKKGNGT